jgi:murein DD-endopeptidase MepM/ murein hydrolase activator NlpD
VRLGFNGVSGCKASISGKSYAASQGNHGTFSHGFPEFQYAWDFDMPEGSEVSAAAAGRIVAIKENGRIGGGNRRFAEAGNYIIIDHGRGIFTKYMHLAYGSSRFMVGEKVRTSDVIALSGKTGFATSAHLHFQVSDYSGKSMHARFIDFDRRGGVPVEGEICT